MWSWNRTGDISLVSLIETHKEIQIEEDVYIQGYMHLYFLILSAEGAKKQQNPCNEHT